MELVVLLVLLIGGVAGVAFFNRPKPEVTPPKQEVDTTPPVKGGSTKVQKKKLEKMTKVDLEKHARDNGVELDRRKTKANMIEDYLQKLK